MQSGNYFGITGSRLEARGEHGQGRALSSHHVPVGPDRALAVPHCGTDRQDTPSHAESPQELATGDLKLFFITVTILTFLLSVLNFDGHSGEREGCYSFALKLEMASPALCCLLHS